MAVEDLWIFCLLLLGFCALSVQEKPLWVELSCGAGPVHAVLEPGWPLLLECQLGASPDEEATEVTWLRDGVELQEGPALRLLSNGSLLVAAPPRDARAPPVGLEGGYSCQRADAFGALTSRVVNLSLASLSRVQRDPEDQVVAAGGAARFECQVEGLPTPIITWEKDRTPLEPSARFISLPSGVLQILSVTDEDAGSYRCVASNAARKRYSQESTLTVTPAGQSSLSTKVELVARPQNSTVILGHPAVMECMAQGHPKPLVSWSRLDGKPIATDVVVLETNLVIPDTRRHHAGVYVCRANKPMTREFVSAPAELRVLSPPVILQPPETVSLSRGNTARFVCNSSGDPPPALQWLRNGQPVQPNGRVKAQSPGVLLINQLGPDDAGYYQCLAANSLGTACATAKLSVIVREGLPSAPRQLQATPMSSTNALLTWERPELNSDQIIGFSVHYQQASGSDNMEYQYAVNNDTMEYQLKELQPHTAYTFYVVAYSLRGASRPSQPVTMEMLEDVPIAPPQLSLLSPSPTEIRVMWLPLSSLQSRGTLTHYRIDYSTLGQGERVFSTEVGGNETQVTLRGLSPNQMYRVRMTAGTRAGFGPTSEWHTHHTPDLLNLTMVLFAPTELKVTAKMHSLHVSWQPPPNHTQISGYKLAYQMLDSEDGEGSDKKRLPVQPIKLRKRVKYHDITGLVPGRVYQVKVWAYNKQTEGYPAVWKGRTEKSPIIPRQPDVLSPPLPPSGIRATANSSRSIWLRWERPRFSSVRIINYTVRCSPAGLRNASLVSYYTSSTQDILLGALKPFTRYEMAVQSNSVNVVGPFSSTVEESTLTDRPSTPPADLQLSALDSSSVLVSWRPPVEPNGIITSYRILFSCNLSQPEHLWTNNTHSGSITSAEVQGLQGGTRYFFKMGACTEVGPGPFSPVKDVHMPSDAYELDINAVTGIIVGVCLGLLCILLCMCVSFRNGKTRDLVGGVDSSSSQFWRGGVRAAPPSLPDCNDCHELETLMPPQRAQPTQPVTEPSEEQSLMGNTAVAEDVTATELKLAWNGSVSCNWANRISRYRDTITEEAPALRNGALDNMATDKVECDAQLYSPVCSNQVEAEVIVHSELSDPPSNSEGGASSSPASAGSQSPPSSQPPPPPSPIDASHPPIHSLHTNPNHTPPPLSNHNGPLTSAPSLPSAAADVGLVQLTSPVGVLVPLTNGFHSPKPPRGSTANPAPAPVEPLSLGGGDSRLCALPASGKSLGGATELPSPSSLSSPSLTPARGLVSVGLVHTTSGEHSSLCP
ncbi:immunoglobulin superfamily DCC subclass member 4 isoform X1 [Alosa sapidissima]|uniref:immunoglobulin superfamily DCC subclass member 4 isoform X1 n=2 Tax=Alosa sapidissima TaxID=34773 RepID=UPI001C095F0D|nr:immunoglobulin superfamily DCC subclass member 4 isoform X1 [Alosa sapidissima]